VEERGRRGEAAPSLGSARGALELRSNVLVRPCGRRGTGPRATIGIGLRIGHLRQRTMDILPLLERGGPIRGRTHKWMTELDTSAELHQTRLAGGCRRVDCDPEALGCPPQQDRVA